MHVRVLVGLCVGEAANQNIQRRAQQSLPATPAVDARQFASANQNISPRTGLTQTETALLSPQEQAMRLRQRGMA